MLIEKLKQVSKQLGWEFNYGKGHWQNIQDLPDDGDLPFAQRKKYFLLLWKDREKIKGGYGETTGYRFTGEFLLVVRSRMSDEDYNYKYETHIKNLESEANKFDGAINDCDDFVVARWKEIEVENMYDTNMDGLKIQFTVEHE